MGSSSKKRKKESKKHKRRSRSRSDSHHRDHTRESSSLRRSRKNSENEYESTMSESPESRVHDHRSESRDQERARRHRHHRHKKTKESRHRHHSPNEVVALDDDDSDSSDCVEVPLTPEAPSISASDLEQQRMEKDQQVKEREQVEKEKLLERERRAQREKDREIQELREKELRKERERERERKREREREHRELEKEQKEYEKEKREHDREREREIQRERDRDRDRERNFDRNRDRERGRYQQKQERSRTRSRSPIDENGAGDCLSIEETNKLRAKLGLKPLEVDSSTSGNNSKEGNRDTGGLSSYKDEWGEFLHKPADNLKDKANAEKIREKLKQHKEKRYLEEKLNKLKTLGESDEEVDDIRKWIDKSKSKETLKMEATKRAKMLEEMDQEFGVDDLIKKEKSKIKQKAYKDRDLKGLRVDHDLDEFTEGKTVILTLRDQGVLDEDDDTLVNVNMIDEERYKKNVENKKLNPLSYGYDVYEETYDQWGNPIERGVLEKYDDEIGTQKKRNFTIGENLEEEREYNRKRLEIQSKQAGKRLETLADIKNELARDTYTEVELATFKKPKKKVKKLRQKLKAEDLLPLNDDLTNNDLGIRQRTDAEIDSKPIVKFELEEDDELQKVLSKALRLKQREPILNKPPQIEQTEIKNEPVEDDDVNSIMTLNATAEFCRTLGDIPTYGMAGNREEDTHELMDFDVEQPVGVDKKYTEVESSTGTWNSVNPNEVQPVEDENSNDIEDVAILDEEPDVGSGVGNALKLALSKGYLEKEDSNRPSNTKMAHLQAKNYSIEDKSYTEDDKFSRRDRFQSGPITDFRDKESFKPNVKLEYIDDNGRILNAKEAFRYLSHKFHGKGPGKNKIEKRLKKMEQEGLMKTMSSTDTPLGTLTMLQQKQKETKTPYVVLSGSNQTIVPSISKHK